MDGEIDHLQNRLEELVCSGESFRQLFHTIL